MLNAAPEIKALPLSPLPTTWHHGGTWFTGLIGGFFAIRNVDGALVRVRETKWAEELNEGALDYAALTARSEGRP